MGLEDNIGIVRQKIGEAAAVSGGSAEDIMLVAASKTQLPEKIQAAARCGVQCFGENYVQELVEKHGKLPDVSWHFIGQLQSNKVKYIVDKISMIESVDRLSLAREIDKRAGRLGRSVDALLQINIGSEEQKGGVAPGDAKQLLDQIAELENVNICGLMCIHPLSGTPEEARPYFARMKKIFDDMNALGYNMKYLSMGMSGDYDTAIREGANIVRVGSLIFGPRQ